MKCKFKMFLTACLLLLTLFVFSGCLGETTPYEANDKENYTVSVKYDANGGLFTTNTSVIVDSFNLQEMKLNGSGEAQAALLSPDNELRGKDAYTATKNGYFLAGWYAQRHESTDEQGNTTYTYSDKWDFEKDVLSVDANAKYSSSDPVLTLYAAWVPQFEIEFYSLSTGEPCGSLSFDPALMTEIKVPVWDQETGALEMYEFPELDGFTFNGAYYDAEGNQAVDQTVTHPGVVNYENGTAENASMKLYVDWMEGNWFHIYTAEQFVKNASLNGCYVLHDDLDFSDEIWPTVLMYGNFGGTIQGNGHVIKNVELMQTNNSKVNAGVFGNLTDDAVLSDVTFENITFTIKSGTRVVGASFGLFAGTISNGVEISNVSLVNSVLQIDSGCYFGVDDYAVGLICGMGNADVIRASGVTCVATGDAPEKLIITVEDNTVNVEFVSE